MAKLPENFVVSPTVLAIFDAYKKKETPRLSRRLGASVIGNPCQRAVWYLFRWASDGENFDGRKLRLFETGNREESRFVENLRAIGCEVLDINPDTKQQFEFTGVGGHLVCKADAMILGVPESPKSWHVGEFKTHNAKSFADLQKRGLRASKPNHYAQLATGMSLSGVDRGLYLAANKDTDDLYAERTKLDGGEAEKLLQWAKETIESSRAPERISSDRESLNCQWCASNEICHGTTAPRPAVAANMNCRTCCHATADTTGTMGAWRCERHEKTLSEQEQQRGCEDHLFIPDFITFAAPIDGGDDTNRNGFVEYANTAGGEVWRNGKSDGAYRSLELKQLPASLVAGEPVIDAVKKQLGGVVVEVE